MTLSVDAKLSAECLLRMRADGGWRTVYKTLELDEVAGQLKSCIQRTYKWEPGWCVAEGKLPFEKNLSELIVFDDLVIHGGAFHVYFNKREANLLGPQAVAPFRAHVDDFIAAGYSGMLNGTILGPLQAVFTRLYFGMNDMEMVVKECLENKGKAQEHLISQRTQQPIPLAPLPGDKPKTAKEIMDQGGWPPSLASQAGGALGGAAAGALGPDLFQQQLLKAQDALLSQLLLTPKPGSVQLVPLGETVPDKLCGVGLSTGDKCGRARGHQGMCGEPFEETMLAKIKQIFFSKKPSDGE